MIIYRDNIIPNKRILNILSDNEFNKKFYDEGSNLITTYYKPHYNYKNLNNIAANFYSKIFETLMKKFSLHDKSRYVWQGWFQSYNKNTSGHEDHVHFCGNEIFSLVHFLSISSQPCFYFVYDGKKEYIDEKSGDIIIFPSWATHGVDPVSFGERKVFSANVSLHNIRSAPDTVVNTSSWENNVLWTSTKA